MTTTTAKRTEVGAGGEPAGRYLLDRRGFLARVMLLPAVVYIVVLVAIPFFLAVASSLSDVTVGDPSFDFVGLRNFRTVVATPPSAGPCSTPCSSRWWPWSWWWSWPRSWP